MNNNTVSTELKDYLKMVESEASNLQKALLSRDSALILDAVTRQRIALDQIQSYISENQSIMFFSPTEKKHVLQPIMHRIRRVLTMNERMARTLLGVIDKTLSNLAIGTKNTANVYNGYGRVAGMAAPILINAQG
ncbi:MAG: hypothetical protein PHP44_05465 [Kiritimatiellae bacterium]|nr:hypothetical protein [Kiritimatiellia bacterium]MDD4735536.1 hypothetical protein [Kiritimatiellia bacterium]